MFPGVALSSSPATDACRASIVRIESAAATVDGVAMLSA
jgi:hypothetical protein